MSADGVCFLNPKSKQSWLRHARLAAAGLAALLVTADQAAAQIRGNSVKRLRSHDPGEAIMAFMCLQKQRITVYATGWILRAPVSPHATP